MQAHSSKKRLRFFRNTINAKGWTSHTKFSLIVSYQYSRYNSSFLHDESNLISSVSISPKILKVSTVWKTVPSVAGVTRDEVSGL